MLSDNARQDILRRLRPVANQNVVWKDGKPDLSAMPPQFSSDMARLLLDLEARVAAVENWVRNEMSGMEAYRDSLHPGPPSRTDGGIMPVVPDETMKALRR